MSQYLSSDEIEFIKEEINQDYQLIEKLTHQINNLRKNIYTKRNILIKGCKHKKEIDRSVASEHTEYYCLICGQDL